jgi:hypothetical protein
MSHILHPLEFSSIPHIWAQEALETPMLKLCLASHSVVREEATKTPSCEYTSLYIYLSPNRAPPFHTKKTPSPCKPPHEHHLVPTRQSTPPARSLFSWAARDVTLGRVIGQDL